MLIKNIGGQVIGLILSIFKILCPHGLVTMSIDSKALPLRIA